MYFSIKSLNNLSTKLSNYLHPILIQQHVEYHITTIIAQLYLTNHKTFAKPQKTLIPFFEGRKLPLIPFLEKTNITQIITTQTISKNQYISIAYSTALFNKELNS